MSRPLAAAIAVQAALALAIALVVLDMRAHNRVETLGGVNVWGYRGTELGRKKDREVRIAVFGGDMAFGWGVASDETIANYAGRLVSVELNRAGRESRVVTPIVAAARGMRISEYAGWIQYFSSLQPDVICLLPDEADHRLDRGRFLPDRQSLVFTATGYSPILPLVLREKAALTHSALLGAAARLLDAADVEAARTVDAPVATDTALRNAIRVARAVAVRGVVLVLPPAWNETTFETPADESGFRTVRLGADLRMSSPELRLDGYHFSAGGHSRAADAVAPLVLDLLHAAEGASR
jgi:hypothetical protein